MIEGTRSEPLPNRRLQGALRGKCIFRQGDPVKAVYRVENGCVRLQLEEPDGQRQVIAFLYPGQTFCVGMETHWATADAITDTVLTRFATTSLWELIASDSAAAMSLLFSADALVTELAHHLARLSHAGALERLTWFIDWVALHGSAARAQTLELPMSRQDIADFLGIAPATVSRLFRRKLETGELRRIGPHRYHYSPAALRPTLLPVSPAPAAPARRTREDSFEAVRA